MSRRVFFAGAIVASVVFSGLAIWGLVDGWLREFFIWAAPFAPFSTAFVAAIAGAIAWQSYLHRRKIDNRAEWWRRVQSAIDLATVDADQIGRSTGLTLLSHLSEDPDITPRDLQLIGDVTNKLIDEVLLDEEARHSDDVENDPAPSGGWLPWMRGILKLGQEGRR